MVESTTQTERQLWWRQVISILVAPVTMTLVIPISIVGIVGLRPPHLDSAERIVLSSFGGVMIVVGLGLWIWTVGLFHRVGRGTLGVGKLMGEPVHLVVHGPYRQVRNPMITGVVCILLGEAAFTGSGGLLVWAATFFVVLAGFIRFWEEPHLEKRYGSEYVEYRRNVPAWIPRLSAWTPSS